MSAVNITDVQVIRNNCLFTDPFEFEVTLEYSQNLKEDLELDFQVVYVPTPSREDKDQKLESVSVGPIPLGTCKFRLTAPAPDASLIDEADLVGATVLLIRILYKNCEFVRIGYLVNVEYLAETWRLQPPSPPIVGELYRYILAEKPRVTRFHLNWENPVQFEYPREVMDQKDTIDDDELMVVDSDESLEEDSSDRDGQAACGSLKNVASSGVSGGSSAISGQVQTSGVGFQWS